MKTINGKNKLERQINKAKKYLGITLIEGSNKYLEIKDFDKENTFILFVNKDCDFKNVWFSNEKDLWIINPLNNVGKPFFVKSWAAINDSNWFHPEFLIFKSWEGNKAALTQLAAGCDDLWKLDEYINSIPGKTLRITKN